jgi:hypothetical protein
VDQYRNRILPVRVPLNSVNFKRQWSVHPTTQRVSLSADLSEIIILCVIQVTVQGIVAVLLCSCGIGTISPISPQCSLRGARQGRGLGELAHEISCNIE